MTMTIPLTLHGVTIGEAIIDEEQVASALNGNYEKHIGKSDHREAKWFAKEYPQGQFLPAQVDAIKGKIGSVLNEGLELLSRETYRDTADALSGVPLNRQYLIADAQAIIEKGIIDRSPYPENNPYPKPLR